LKAGEKAKGFLVQARRTNDAPLLSQPQDGLLDPNVELSRFAESFSGLS